MALITWIRRISVLLLVLLVGFGTIYVDRRCTVLLVPPFVAYWSTYGDNSFMDLPVMRLLSAPFRGESVRSRMLLAVAGGFAGLAITYFIS